MGLHVVEKLWCGREVAGMVTRYMSYHPHIHIHQIYMYRISSLSLSDLSISIYSYLKDIPGECRRPCPRGTCTSCKPSSSGPHPDTHARQECWRMELQEEKPFQIYETIGSVFFHYLDDLRTSIIHDDSTVKFSWKLTTGLFGTDTDSVDTMTLVAVIHPLRIGLTRCLSLPS